MSQVTRRHFLEEVFVAAAAGAGVAPFLAAAEKTSKSPNERLGVAVIGLRGRGRDHVQAFKSRSDCEVRIVCDADRDVAAATAAMVGPTCRFVQDMRHVFNDPSIDVVSIATCNHWHALAAIWAMQAGKDAYVEKPASWCIAEGRRMVQAARKFNRICQVGTQYRSDLAKAAAARYMAEGKLGKLLLARSLCYKRRLSIGPKVEGVIPPGVNYELWAGPAPMSPVTRKSFHYDWHWFWDFGNGDLGNSDVHRVDLVRFGLGVDRLPRAVMSYGGRVGYEDAGETPNTQVVIHDYGDVTVVQEVRGLDCKSGFGPQGGMFKGTDGYIEFGGSGATVFDLKGTKVHEFPASVEGAAGASAGLPDLSQAHFANFIKAVRSRRPEDLNSDISGGHLSAGLCHLGNISYRLGRKTSPQEIVDQLQSRKVHEDVLDNFDRTRKHLAVNGVDVEKTRLTLGPWLEFDPQKETFVNNSQADRLLTREYRKPFVVPSENEL